MPGFTNSPIDSAALPTVEHLTFTPLASRYKTALYAERAVGSLILLAIVVGVAIYANLDSAISLGLVAISLVGAILWFASVPTIFRHKGWLVREHDISNRTGVLTRRLSTVPFARVQNVAVRQSFLDRVVDVATLDVFTAGSDLHIAGLTPDVAERLRLLVLERAGVDEHAVNTAAQNDAANNTAAQNDAANNTAAQNDAANKTAHHDGADPRLAP